MDFDSYPLKTYVIENQSKGHMKQTSWHFVKCLAEMFDVGTNHSSL